MLTNSSMLERAKADIYRLDNGLYRRKSVFGLYKEERDAVIGCMVDYVLGPKAASCTDSYLLNVIDTVSREYDEMMKSESLEIKLEGLQKCLERYEESSGHGECGPWTFKDIGRDCIALYYGFHTVAYCDDNEKYWSVRRGSNLPDKTFSEVFDMIHSVFSECVLAESEKRKMQENSRFNGK